MLGDIGGLSDALLIIGKIVMVATIAIKGNELDDFLLENIFNKQPTQQSTRVDRKDLQHIKTRAPIIVTQW